MTYRTEGRFCIATIDGETYCIPDMWLVGATRGGKTIGEAVAVWHEQAKLEAEYTRRWLGEIVSDESSVIRSEG